MAWIPETANTNTAESNKLEVKAVEKGFNILYIALMILLLLIIILLLILIMKKKRKKQPPPSYPPPPSLG